MFLNVPQHVTLNSCFWFSPKIKVTFTLYLSQSSVSSLTVDSTTKTWDEETYLRAALSNRAGETSSCDRLGGSGYIRGSTGATTTLEPRLFWSGLVYKISEYVYTCIFLNITVINYEIQSHSRAGGESWIESIFTFILNLIHVESKKKFGISNTDILNILGRIFERIFTNTCHHQGKMLVSLKQP